MRLRGNRIMNCEKNFLVYQLDDNNRLVKSKRYGGSSDWSDLLFQANKFKGRVIYQRTLVNVFVGRKELMHLRNLKLETGQDSR